MLFSSALPLLFTLALSALTSASVLVKRGSYTQVTNYGSNPSGTQMWIYVPTSLKSNPAIIVAAHYCTGTAQAYYTSTQYAQYADQYGYIVIYPQSPYSGTCHDVSSKSTLTHNGGGESNSIANMVTWTLNQYKGDASRVFVTGSSSGAMMTNVMAATYPNLFAAATVYSGVPAGCFYSASNQVDAWNSTCAQGQVNASPELWASIVKNMYPGYTGSRPKMLIRHGDADTTLLPRNYNETIKEWAGVFGYDYTKPAKTEANTPQARYTRYTFGPYLTGIYANGVGHTVPVNVVEDLTFFGIIGGSSPTTSTTSTKAATSTPTLTTSTIPKTTTTTAAPVTTTPASGENCAPIYAQCGGSGWTGATCCQAGSTCKYSNTWYSQCL